MKIYQKVQTCIVSILKCVFCVLHLLSFQILDGVHPRLFLWGNTSPSPPFVPSRHKRCTDSDGGQTYTGPLLSEGEIWRCSRIRYSVILRLRSECRTRQRAATLASISLCLQFSEKNSQFLLKTFSMFHWFGCEAIQTLNKRTRAEKSQNSRTWTYCSSKSLIKWWTLCFPFFISCNCTLRRYNLH